jgi:hypothetical protein
MMDAVAHELLTERILFSMASNTRVTDACTVNKSVRTSKSGDSGGSYAEEMPEFHGREELNRKR